jgi:Zn-dependent protease
MSELAAPTPPPPAPQGWPPPPPSGWPPPPPSGWQPAPSAQPSRPATHRRGLIGSLLALLFGAGKYGVVLLKLGKLGPTLISMVLSLGALTLFYGPAFGAGLLALIAVHEFGHLLFAKYEGVAVGMPVFLGPFGAVIGLKQPPRDARQEAVIAIGGPVVGTAGSLAVLLWGLSLPSGYLHGLLVSLAYFGFFLNLFNLVPMSPLDGGRVASALSRWANVVGLAVVAGLVVVMAAAGNLNPFLVIILLLGGWSTVQRFRQARTTPEYSAMPAATRLWIGVAYLGMLAVTAIGMTVTHGLLPVHAGL